MSFGIGTNAKQTNVSSIRGEQREIACECWFTSTGKMTPLMIKIQDEDGEYQVIKPITVHSQKKLMLAGTPFVQFNCTIMLRGQEQRVRLLYYQNENRWAMNLL